MLPNKIKMKKLIIIFALLPLLAMCQVNPKKNTQAASNTKDTVVFLPQGGGISFQVEKLLPPKKLLPMESSKNIYKNWLTQEMEAYNASLNKKNLFKVLAYSDLPDSIVATFGYRSFFEGIHAAYADHRPIVLSPDIIWLLISQGFAQHVNANPEKLRHYFAGYQGKISLIANAFNNYDTLKKSDWEKIFSNFSGQISKNVGSELVDALTCNFSTTTSIEKTVSEITIMNAMKSYFEYIVESGCGIPQITLEGSTSDWQKVLDKANQLKKYDLQWWILEIEPVLKQFVEASKGNIDKSFWQKMFKKRTEEGDYETPVATFDGWIVKFFPYDKDGNKMSLKTIDDETTLPEEIVKVNLRFVYTSPVDGKSVETPLELWAGFVGLQQNKTNFALRPKIGWMVCENNIKKEAPDMENGQLMIRVKDFPPQLLSVPHIGNLYIDFLDEINIPDEFANTKINYLTLNGKIIQSGIDRIVKLFPHTTITINGKVVNEVRQDN